MRKIKYFLGLFSFCLSTFSFSVPSFALSPNNCLIPVSKVPTETGSEGQSSSFYGTSYGEFVCALKTQWAILQDAESNPSGTASCHFIHTFVALGQNRVFQHGLAGNSNPYWDGNIKDSATLWDRIANWVRNVYDSNPGTENPQGFVGSAVGGVFPIIRGDGGNFTENDFTSDLITILMLPSQWPEGITPVYNILVVNNFTQSGSSIQQYQPVNYQFTYTCVFGSGDDGGDSGGDDSANCPNIRVTTPFPIVRVRYKCE